VINSSPLHYFFARGFGDIEWDKEISVPAPFPGCFQVVTQQAHRASDRIVTTRNSDDFAIQILGGREETIVARLMAECAAWRMAQRAM
jgi:hypothetical protein